MQKPITDILQSMVIFLPDRDGPHAADPLTASHSPLTYPQLLDVLVTA